MADFSGSNIQDALNAFGTVRGFQRQGAMDEIAAQQRQRQQGIQDAQLKEQQFLTDTNNIASEANGFLQFETKEQLQNAMIRRSKELQSNPKSGINQEDIADMVNRLGTDQGFADVQQELRADLARAQDVQTAARQEFQEASQANIQFGGQQTFKDSQDNLFFGTTKRNPTTGAVESVLAAVDGSAVQPIGAVEQVGAFGQTAAEKTQSKITEAGGSERAKLESQAALIAGVEQEKATGKSIGQLRSDIKKANVAVLRNAPVEIRKLNRVAAVLEKAGTGTTQAFLASIGKVIPGSTPANLEDALSAAADFTLNSLSRIKGPITEKELAFIGTTSPSIRNSPEGNRLIMQRVIQAYKDELELAKAQRNFKGNPEDFDVEAFIAEKEGQRNASFDLGGVQPQEAVQQPSADQPESFTLPNGVVVRKVQ